MDIELLCAGIKERVALEMRETAVAETRRELLLVTLADIGKVVFPALGKPGEPRDCRRTQEAVLDLVTFVAVPLLREGDGRAALFVADLAAECPDPMIGRKLAACARELQAKSAEGSKGTRLASTKALVGDGGIAATVLLVLLLAWPQAEPRFRSQPEPTRREAASQQSENGRRETAAPQPISVPPAAPEGEGGEAAGRRQKGAVSAAVLPVGEQATKVRVVDNQVLVPVTVTQGGTSVRLELVLDTGATRTALHENVAARLPIDLRSARTASAELADGRTVRSRIARLDSLTVGPYVQPAMEVELISYGGGAGMHDGLLGMDFLAGHRYQIDMEHEVIRWY